MPSSSKARAAMLEAINIDCPDTTEQIADLGSGWGHLTISIARQYPQKKVTGFELSIVPWLISCVWAKLARVKNVTFKRKNYLACDLRGYQCYCCYLFTGGMALLEQKLDFDKSEEEKWLISNTFSFPTKPPDNVRIIDDFYKSKIYTYQL